MWVFSNHGRASTLFLIIFFTAVFLLGLYYFNSFYVPTSDFFTFRSTAVAFLHLEAPSSYHKLPFYSLLMAVLSTILPGPDPVLFAAEIINLGALLGSSLLLYLLSTSLLGKSGLVVTYLFTLHPLTVYMAAQPIANILTVLFVLLAFYSRYRQRNWCYLASFFASITRYEGFLLVPAFVLTDLLLERRKLRTLTLGILSSVGLMAWIVINYQATGQINPYYRYFGPDIPAAGLEYVKAIVYTFSNFMGPTLATRIPLKFAGVGIVVLGTMGFYSLVKRFRNETLPILLFVIMFVVVSAAYFSRSPEHCLPILWIMYLSVVGGVVNIIGWVKRWTDYASSGGWNNRWGKAKSQVWLTGIAFAVPVVIMQNGVDEARIPFLVIYGASIAMGIHVLLNSIRVGSGRAIVVAGVIGVVMGFVVRGNDAQIQREMNGARYLKGELRLVGEWCSKNLRNGETILITEPWVADYYSRPPCRGDESFVPSADLAASSAATFLTELKERGITYVVWDSHHGKLSEDDYYFKKYKVRLLSGINSGNRAEHFELVETVRAGPSYAHIYKVVP